MAKRLSLGDMLERCPEIAAELNRAQYLGCCIQQSPGAWTRMGPTWRHEDYWITIGPGVASWGTSAGLAELAVSKAPSPKFHAVGIAVSPTPNLIYPVMRDIAANYKEIDQLTTEAECYQK